MPAKERTEITGLLTRRAFSRRAFGAAGLGLLPVTSIQEQDNAAPPRNDAAGLGEKPADLSIADWEEVRTRYTNVLQRYGARLSLEQKQRIGRILTENEHMLASIRSFVVQNGDPSACTLRLDLS